MKSAYELALERMAASGIEPPREDALNEEARNAIVAIRAKAEAELAQLEILHHDRAGKLDPASREQADEEYRIDRERVVSRREREIDAIRKG